MPDDHNRRERELSAIELFLGADGLGFVSLAEVVWSFE